MALGSPRQLRQPEATPGNPSNPESSRQPQAARQAQAALAAPGTPGSHKQPQFSAFFWAFLLTFLRSQRQRLPLSRDYGKSKLQAKACILQRQRTKAATEKAQKSHRKYPENNPKLVLVICECQSLALSQDSGKLKL